MSIYTHISICSCIYAVYIYKKLEGNIVEVSNPLCTKMFILLSSIKEYKSTLYQVP